MDSPKILFLYDKPVPFGYEYTRTRKFIHELQLEYELEQKFGVYDIERYSSIKHAQAKNEIITEDEFLSAGYDLVFIENQLYVETETDAHRANSSTYKKFLDKGGALVFGFGDTFEFLNGVGIEKYNKFLQNSGLPQIRTPASREEFLNYESYRDTTARQTIRGVDEIAPLQNELYRFYVQITDTYKKQIPPKIRSVYQDINKLFLPNPIQFDTLENVLIGGNRTTKLLTVGDLWWDGASPTFGVFNDLSNGCSVLLPGHMILDSVLDENPSDNMKFLMNLVNLLIVRQRERKELMFGVNSESRMLLPMKISPHENISTLTRRMNNALRIGDYSLVLHTSASIFETLAKEIVEIESVANKTLKSFFDRYRKDSLLPEPVLDYILSIYDSRNVTPLAGHGSKDIPNVSKVQAIVICELTKAIVSIQYQLKS